MKQFNIEISNTNELNGALSELNRSLMDGSYSALLFHLYSSIFTNDQLQTTTLEIKSVFPEAKICGTSTNGDIYEGNLKDAGLVIAVSAFESTSVEVHMLKCVPGEEEKTGDTIKNIIDSSSNIRAAEILITLKSINSHIVLNAAEKISKDIPVFGGGSANYDLHGLETKVISADEICDSGVVVVTYSGDDLFVDVKHAIGWKPLGKEFLATKIEGKRLYELNNTPAGEVYDYYLDIHADEDFFANILEFPIMSNQHGFEVLRLPFSCNKDDRSIILAADIDKGTPVHLSYGDPEVIQSDVAELLKSVKEFAPEAIFLVSCGVRRLYWKHLINKETGPFSDIAPVAGFYSSGEIMRMDKYLIEHHVTLIAISMREGDRAAANPTCSGDHSLPVQSEEEKVHSQISMVRRLANYINVTTAELQESNDKLREMADTDELTGLYNRRMLTRIISDALIRANKYDLSIIFGIIDIDLFKEVNDTYGHNVGDMVLKTMGMNMYKEVEKLPSGIFGRWGGEEFIFMAPMLKLDRIKDNLERARQRVSSIPIETVGPRSISLGVTEFKTGDTLETILHRADLALYEAKENGRNQMRIK